jgi:regulator of Ty1 transposition protein 103
MADFNREGFERRLNRLSETQESIENLSAWVIQQVKFAKAVADSWMHVFHSSRSHRYQTLLYLVNDVLQNGRRRGLDFSLAFREVLPQSLAMAQYE